MLQLFNSRVFAQHFGKIFQALMVYLFTATDTRLANAWRQGRGVKDHTVIVIVFVDEVCQILTHMAHPLMQNVPLDSQGLVFLLEKQLVNGLEIIVQPEIACGCEHERKEYKNKDPLAQRLALHIERLI